MTLLGNTKFIAVMFVLLAFVGQTVATAVVHCGMELSGSVSSMSHAEMGHSQMGHSQMGHGQMEHVESDYAEIEHANHQMSAELSDESMSSKLMNCCDLTSDCSMGACATALLLTEIYTVDRLVMSQKIIQLPYPVKTQSITTLYRPPILI